MSGRMLTIAGVLALAGSAIAQDDAPPTAPAAETDWVLENGLRVWLHPVTKATHTAVVVVYDVGEAHDPEGQSGLAHLLEHCYVTAAAGDRPARTVEDWAQAVPVARNAQTGRDYTVFAAVVDKAQGLDAVAEAADRMGALTITDADLARERPRLESELHNMFEGLPELAALNHARERAWPSPAGARKGGVPAQVQALTVAQLQARWASHYKPANARLLVAGAFHGTKMRELIAQRFGALPAGNRVGAGRNGADPVWGRAPTMSVTPIRPGLPGVMAVAVRAPEPADPAFAPFCVALSRFWVRQATRRGPKVLVRYMPLDDPGVAWVMTPLRGTESADDALQRIDGFLRDGFAEPVESVHRMFARTHFAHILGTGPTPRPETPDALYAVSFRHARMAQLGVDAGDLTRRLNSVTGEAFAAMRTAVFAPERRVIVAAELKKSE